MLPKKILDLLPFTILALSLILAEKIPVNVIIAGTWFFTYLIKQQLIEEIAKYDEDLSARDAKYTADLSARDANYLDELATRDTRFTAELATRDAQFIAFDTKLTSELSARDTNYTVDAQRFLTILNDNTANISLLEHNLTIVHESINQLATNLEALQDQQTETDSTVGPLSGPPSVHSNHSTGPPSVHSNHATGPPSVHSSGGSSSGSNPRDSSGARIYTGYTLTTWQRFVPVFNRIKSASGFSEDEMYHELANEISKLGGRVIKASTIMNFYKRITTPRTTTSDAINAWVDRKTNVVASSSSPTGA